MVVNTADRGKVGAERIAMSVLDGFQAIGTEGRGSHPVGNKQPTRAW